MTQTRIQALEIVTERYQDNRFVSIKASVERLCPLLLDLSHTDQQFVLAEIKRTLSFKAGTVGLCEWKLIEQICALDMYLKYHNPYGTAFALREIRTVLQVVMDDDIICAYAECFENLLQEARYLPLIHDDDYQIIVEIRELQKAAEQR